MDCEQASCSSTIEPDEFECGSMDFTITVEPGQLESDIVFFDEDVEDCRDCGDCGVEENVVGDMAILEDFEDDSDELLTVS